MPAWLLPPNVSDVLQHRAHVTEDLRRRFLDVLISYGYELVQPPLLQYMPMDWGNDWREEVFMVDGANLVLRSDTTPQIARIDAHVLNTDAVVRLCYANSVLRRRNTPLQGPVETIQLGAECFGENNFVADMEMVRIAAHLLKISGIADWRFDVSHIGIIRALFLQDKKAQQDKEAVINALRAKDAGTLRDITTLPDWLALIGLYGGQEVLSQARKHLSPLPEIQQALAEIQQLLAIFPIDHIHIDLADIRGYSYHSGMMFAVYTERQASYVLAGGRYDTVGHTRQRSATGFSLDLLTLAGFCPHQLPHRAVWCNTAVASSAAQQESLALFCNQLRANGTIVVEAIYRPQAETYHCDQTIGWQGEGWQVIPLRT